MIRRIAIPFNEILSNCYFDNKWYSCDQLFSEILTEDGICYTFNILKSSEVFRETTLQDDYKYYHHNYSSPNWSMETGYSKGSPKVTYPFRATFGSEDEVSLRLTLNANDYDRETLCQGPMEGFKISIHSPDELPQLSKDFFRVPLDNVIQFKVQPKMMITSDGLKSYPPNRQI